jgi:hypothetical protein
VRGEGHSTHPSHLPIFLLRIPITLDDEAHAAPPLIIKPYLADLRGIDLYVTAMVVRLSAQRPSFKAGKGDGSGHKVSILVISAVAPNRAARIIA